MVAWNQIFLGIELSSNRLNICSFGALTSRKLWYLVISFRYLMPFSSSSILLNCYEEIATLYTSTYMNSNICLINTSIVVYMVQHRGVALRSVTWCLCVIFPFTLISVIPICFISLLLFLLHLDVYALLLPLDSFQWFPYAISRYCFFITSKSIYCIDVLWLITPIIHVPITRLLISIAPIVPRT
jgi:hypothetical protein